MTIKMSVHVRALPPNLQFVRRGCMKNIEEERGPFDAQAEVQIGHASGSNVSPCYSGCYSAMPHSIFLNTWGRGHVPLALCITIDCNCNSTCTCTRKQHQHERCRVRGKGEQLVSKAASGGGTGHRKDIDVLSLSERMPRVVGGREFRRAGIPLNRAGRGVRALGRSSSRTVTKF